MITFVLIPNQRYGRFSSAREHSFLLMMAGTWLRQSRPSFRLAIERHWTGL